MRVNFVSMGRHHGKWLRMVRFVATKVGEGRGDETMAMVTPDKPPVVKTFKEWFGELTHTKESL